MGYREKWKQELKKKFKNKTAMDLYLMGQKVKEYELESRDTGGHYLPSFNRTRIGDIALARYWRGRPERRLP